MATMRICLVSSEKDIWSDNIQPYVINFYVDCTLLTYESRLIDVEKNKSSVIKFKRLGIRLSPDTRPTTEDFICRQ
jgi:hypothetical protein